FGGVLLLEPRVGHVVAKPVEDDLGQETSAKEALVEDPLGAIRGDHVAAARAAGVLLLGDLVDEGDFQPLELLARLFAELLALLAPGGTRQLVLRQRAPRAIPR